MTPSPGPASPASLEGRRGQRDTNHQGQPAARRAIRVIPAAKSIAEWAVLEGGFASRSLARHHGRTLVLSYHNIVPDDAPPAGDRSLHLPLGEFRRQVEWILSTHDAVDLDLALTQPNSGRPRVVFTFDDAYRGAVTLALPVLARAGAPATVFVVSRFVGSEGFWWDRYAPSEGWDPDSRQRLLTELAGRDELIDRWAQERRLEPSELDRHWGVASEDELRAAIQMAGGSLSLECHTAAHPNLAVLSDSEVRRELTGCRDWLRERFSSGGRWVAYPYGSFNEAVERIARDCGFAGGLAVAGGWWPRDPALTPFRLPRWNVPGGISNRGFRIRASGLWCR